MTPSIEPSVLALAAAILPDRSRYFQLYDEMQSAATEPGVDITLAGQTNTRLRELARKSLDQILSEQISASGFDTLQTDNEMLQLQTHQLQEEVESYYKDTQEQRREIERLKKDLLEKNQQEDVISTLRHSLELSELQIKKFQQELEDYF